MGKTQGIEAGEASYRMYLTSPTALGKQRSSAYPLLPKMYN